MAMVRFSLTFFCPINSRKKRGRSFSSKEASSSARAAETRRSLLNSFWSGAATWAIVKRNLEKGQSTLPQTERRGGKLWEGTAKTFETRRKRGENARARKKSDLTSEPPFCLRSPRCTHSDGSPEVFTRRKE